MIRIISKRDGFRRCGIPHPSTPTDYSNDRFSKEELTLLKAETMLVVQKISDKKKEDTGDK